MQFNKQKEQEVNKSFDTSPLQVQTSQKISQVARNTQISRKKSNQQYEMYNNINENNQSNVFHFQQFKTKRGRILSQNIKGNKQFINENNNSFSHIQNRPSPDKIRNDNHQNVQYQQYLDNTDIDRRKQSDGTFSNQKQRNIKQNTFFKSNQLKTFGERKNGVRSQNTSYNDEELREKSPLINYQSQTPLLPTPITQNQNQGLNRTQKLFNRIQQNVSQQSKPQFSLQKQINLPKSYQNRRNFSKLRQRQTSVQTTLTPGSPVQNQNKKQYQTIDDPENINDDNQVQDKQYFLEIGTRTKQGVLSTNPNKVNQDIFIVANEFYDQFSFFAVGDGHGSKGHLVSGYVKEKLVQYLKMDQQLLLNNPKQALYNSIGMINHSLLNLSEIDCNFSGTTLVCVLLINDSLYTANVGDSRAIIGRHIKQQQWDCKQITIDHKPNLSYEAERIIKNGGRIDSYRDQFGNQLGPQRVWLKKENIPGLAMSRSIGDNIATSVGVTWQPELFEFKLEKQDKFMLIASDGVFEFLENQNIVNLIEPFYQQNNIQGACDMLLKKAHSMWTQEDDSVVDDITFILLFIHHRD